MISLLLTVFATSLIGSLHCAGMCGPFAWLTVSHATPQRWVIVQAMGGYHGARLVLYASLGGLAGGLGWIVDLGGSAAGLQQLAAWLAGLAMIGYGLLRLIGSRNGSWGGAIFSRIAGPPTRWLATAHHVRGWRRAALIGMVSSLMPCGWLYAFVLAATGTGNPGAGAVLMVAFWLGTVPILALIVIGAGRCAPAVAVRVPQMLAVAVLLIGVYTIGLRGAIDLSGLQRSIGDQSVQAAVQVIEHTDLPCCQQGASED
jgi:sulfite exporter TauE/SafE